MGYQYALLKGADALTQEAAYRSLLTAQRRELHHRAAVTLEALFPGRLEEHYGSLAHHFLAAAQDEEVAKGIEYAVRAGERNMALPAYTEAVRFYHMALEALVRQTLVDEAQRCTVLLRLGEAQRKAGESLQALDTLQQAADTARSQGAAEHFACAALEFELTTWLSKLAAEPAVRLLEEALPALGEEANVLRAKVLGSLARAWLFTGALEQAAVYAQQAVEVARQAGDAGVLAFNLQVLLTFPWRPEETETRLTYATEMLQLAQEANEAELVHNAHAWSLMLLLELGDIQAVDAALDALGQGADKMQMPVYLYVKTTYQAMRALLHGRFAEADRLAIHMFTLGQRMQGENLAGTFGLLMFALRREQGRLNEVEPALRHFVQQQGVASAWRPGLALLYSELGRLQDARQAFERLAQYDFTDLPRDGLWMACLTYLADVCTFLGDTARAAILYQLLRPYAGRTVVIGNATACYGAASRYLGMLATTMACWGEAERHFEDALTMNARMGARPWFAHTQLQYALMLSTRNQPGDHARATALRLEALATARELGMRTLEARITGQQEHTTPAMVPSQALPDTLSPREVEVLRLIAAGKSNRDIADTLFISLNTVATHVRNILAKTGCANRTEAAAYSLRHGRPGV